MKQHKTLGARLAYTSGAFGNDVFYATLSTYFIMFVTTHLFNTGNQALNAKMIVMMSNAILAMRIIEIFLDPMIGNAIDRTESRWGKFKPWVVIGGVVSSLLLLVLFTNMGGLNQSPVLYFIAFVVIYFIMNVFYSFKDTAFWSMIPAMSLDSREREKTATFARVGSTVGTNLVGVVIMPIILFFSVHSNKGTGDQQGWFWFVAVVAVIGIVTAIAVGLWTQEVQSKLRETKEKTTLRQVTKVLFNNDQLMWLAFAYLFYGLGINTVNALQLYYFSFIVGDSGKYSILYAVNTVVGLISVTLFPSLAKKFNRKNLFVYCMLCMLVGVALYTVAGANFTLTLIAAELFFIPQPLAFLVVLMIISDAVEYGQYKSGHRDEALTLSVRPLVDKFGGAISNWFVSMVAVMAGMTTGATAASITTHDQLIFKCCMFGIPAIMMIISLIIFMKKVDLTEDMHAEILAKLEAKMEEKHD